jgi:hypothetical protein
VGQFTYLSDNDAFYPWEANWDTTSSSYAPVPTFTPVKSKWSLDGVRVSDFGDSYNGEDVSVNAQGTTVAVYTRDETLEGAPYASYVGAVNILKKI